MKNLALFLYYGTCLLFFCPSTAQLQELDAELVVQSGHYEEVLCLAVSPDGRYVASGGADGKIILWDVQSGKAYRKIHAHVKGVKSLAFSPDGKVLISGGDRSDQDLVYWDWLQGKAIFRVEKAHSNSIETLVFSPDGQWLLTGTYREAKIWKVADRSLYKEITGKGKAFNDLIIKHTVEHAAFHPKLPQVLLGTAHKDIILLSYPELELIRSVDVKGTESLAQTLAYRPDGKTFLHTGSMGKIVERDAQSLESITETEGIGTGTPCPCLISPKQEEVFTGCGGDIRIQDLKSGVNRILPDVANSISTATYDPSGTLIGIAGLDKNDQFVIKLFNAKTGTLLRQIKGYPGKVISLNFSQENGYLASGNQGRPTNIWSLGDTEGIRNFLDGTFSKRGDIYSSVVFGPEDKSLLNATQSAVFVWDTQTGALKNRVFERAKERDNLQFSPLGNKMVLNTHYIKVLNPLTGEVQKDLGPARLATRSVALGPQGKIIYAGGFKEIKPWDADTYQELPSLEIGGYAWEMAFHPKKNHLITQEGYLYLRNAETGEEIQELARRAEENLIFTADGRYLISSYLDTIFYRDTQANYAITRRLLGHEDQVSALALSPDQRLLASGSLDGSIKLWDIQSGDLLVTLIALNEEDFIMTTPDLYYMTTKQGANGLAFRIGEKIYPFDQFDLQFNRPDIVLERIGYASPEIIEVLRKAYLKRIKRLNYKPEQFQKDFRLPEIKLAQWDFPISVSEKEITLEVEASDAQFPLDRLLVSVNDVPIHGRQGSDLKKQKKLKIRQKIRIPLSNGKNQIKISVLNSNGNESLRQSFEVNYDGQPSPVRRHLIALGVSSFADKKMNLQYARKDAQDLVKEFMSYPSGDQFTELQIDTLYDEQVTLENVARLKAKLENTQVDDHVVIFVASHGLLDQNQDYYLATHDVDFPNPSRRGLPYFELESLLDGIPARNKMLLIDACHSGELDKEDEVALAQNTQAGSLRARGFGEQDQTIEEDQDVDELDLDFDVGSLKQVGLKNSFALMKEVFADLRRGTGATVIASAGGLEYALEGDEWKNGVFTYCLLHGLRNGTADQNKDQKIYLSELQRFLQSEVPKLTNGRQQPTSRIENLINDFQVW